jgi:dihydroorotate dehydrogenase (fumarate)
MDLKSNYLGVSLKNPIIIGASNLVTDLGMAKKLEDAGAAAVVYKSLFEEQLDLEAAELEDELSEYEERNAEMTSLFPKIQHSGPKSHLLALKKLKETLSIPVFGSLNCISDDKWVEYARYMAETGIDGLELNFYSTISDFSKSPQEIEAAQIEILKKVKKAVSIPVGVKLSSFYTNPLYLIKSMDQAGADGFVLFNRLFQPDIDTDHLKMKLPYNLSSHGDHRLSLRFAGLLAGNVKGTICGNTGIIDGNDAIALLLAGADSLQIVTAIYKNGAEQVTTILEQISDFMKKKGYNAISDFKGKLSKKNIKEPYAYQRAQYVDYLMHSKEFLKRYPV